VTTTLEADFSGLVGAGVTEDSLRAEAPAAARAVEQIQGLVAKGDVGFFELAAGRETAKACL